MSEKVLGFKVKEKENKDYALCEVEKMPVCPHSEIGHNLEDLRYEKHECSDGTYESWDCPECSFSTEELEEHLANGHYREEFNRIPKYEKVPIVSIEWMETYVKHIRECFEKNQPSDFEAGEETGRIEGLEVLLAEAKKEARRNE